MTLLRCMDLEVGHDGRAHLPPISLDIEPGEFWAILGRNGSGKSTWFRTALGLLPPVSGGVEQAAELRVSYLAQRMAFDDLYPVSVGEVVAMGLVQGTGFFPRQRRIRVARALDEVGAGELRGRSFRALSEGQKQRVLLARMLAAEAQLAFLDEPTAAMDAVAEAEAMELLDRLRREHDIAVVVVSHHLAVARRFATQALFVDDEHPAVVVGPPDDVFTHSAFEARYGKQEPRT